MPEAQYTEHIKSLLGPKLGKPITPVLFHNKLIRTLRMRMLLHDQSRLDVTQILKMEPMPIQQPAAG